MKKYLVFRLPNKLAISELIAVEYGMDILEVTPTLMSAVSEDMKTMPESSCYVHWVEPPSEPVFSHRYQYEMRCSMLPPSAKKETISVTYVIREKEMKMESDDAKPRVV